jgi:hypothetical protein
LGKGPRYAVYDFAYVLNSGEGSRCVMIKEKEGSGADVCVETKSRSLRGPQMMLASRFVVKTRHLDEN